MIFFMVALVEPVLLSRLLLPLARSVGSIEQRLAFGTRYLPPQNTRFTRYKYILKKSKKGLDFSVAACNVFSL